MKTHCTAIREEPCAYKNLVPSHSSNISLVYSKICEQIVQFYFGSPLIVFAEFLWHSSTQFSKKHLKNICVALKWV